MAKDKAAVAPVAPVEPVDAGSGVTGEGQAQEKAKVRLEISISLATSIPDVVRLDAEGKTLVWDADSFPVLEEDTLRKLGHENRKRYFMTQAQSKVDRVRRQQAAAKGREGSLEVWDPLEFQTHLTRDTRKRKGWHQTWIRGDQFDAKVTNGPYLVVRKPHKDYPNEAAGEETGEVLKVKEGTVNGEDRVLIAVECLEDLYDQHIHAMAYKSHRRYAHDQPAAFRAFLEKKNSEIGAPRETLRMVDMSTPDREIRREHGDPMPAPSGDDED